MIHNAFYFLNRISKEKLNYTLTQTMREMNLNVISNFNNVIKLNFDQEISYIIKEFEKLYVI